MDAIPSIGATLAGLAVGIVSLITVGPINAIIILVLWFVLSSWRIINYSKLWEM